MIIRFLGIILIFGVQCLSVPVATTPRNFSVQRTPSSLSTKSSTPFVEQNLVSKQSVKELSVAKRITSEPVIETLARDVAANRQKFNLVLQELQNSKPRVPSLRFDQALSNEVSANRRSSVSLSNEAISLSTQPKMALSLGEGFMLKQPSSGSLSMLRSPLQGQGVNPSGKNNFTAKSTASEQVIETFASDMAAHKQKFNSVLQELPQQLQVSLSNTFKRSMPESTPVLKQAKATVVKNAQEYLSHDAGQRQQAMGSLFGQRQKLGIEYQMQLAILEANARPIEAVSAKSHVQQRIGNKNSEQIFKESGVQGNYKMFMQDFANNNNKSPQQLTAWLEGKLNLRSGGLQTPDGQAKVQKLYEQISLIKNKKEISDQALFRVKSSSTRNLEMTELNKLMSEIQNIAPEVQTPTQKYLLERLPQNSQAVSSISQLQSARRGVEKMMGELSSAPVQAKSVQKSKPVSELIGEGIQRYEVSTPSDLASYIGRQPLGNSEHVLVDYSKPSRTADSLAKLNDFSAAVHADKPFIASAEGKVVHEQLLQSVESIVKNAREYKTQSPQQRAQAIENLQNQNRALEALQKKSSVLQGDGVNFASKEAALLNSQVQFTRITINRMIRELSKAPMENIVLDQGSFSMQ